MQSMCYRGSEIDSGTKVASDITKEEEELSCCAMFWNYRVGTHAGAEGWCS